MVEMGVGNDTILLFLVSTTILDAFFFTCLNAYLIVIFC